MADHQDLVQEIPSVERMGTQERLKHAKKRRSQQLKKWANYDKQLDKDHSKKAKKGQPLKKHPRRQKTTRVRFKGNIMLLESAARNDLEDGKFLWLIIIASLKKSGKYFLRKIISSKKKEINITLPT